MMPGDGDTLVYMSKFTYLFQDREKPADKDSAETIIKEFRDLDTFIVTHDETVMSSLPNLILFVAQIRGSIIDPTYSVFGAFEFYHIQRYVSESDRTGKVYYAWDPDQGQTPELNDAALTVLLDFAFGKAAQGGLQLSLLVFAVPEYEIGFMNELTQSLSLFVGFESIKGPGNAQERGVMWCSFGVKHEEWMEAKERIAFRAQRHT